MTELESKDIETFGKIINNLSRYIILSNGIIISKSYHNQNIVKILRQQTDRYGYNYIKLFDDSKKSKKMKIHRLVAKAFIPNPENKPQINHKDGNKQNNNYTNLEWVNQKENMNHAKKNNLFNPVIGENHYKSKLKEHQVRKIKRLLKSKMKHGEIAKLFGVCRQSIGSIKNNISWRHIK